MVDYLFLGCSTRIGTYRVVGPVSGEQLAIPILGTWINQEDADILKEQEIEIFCHRAGGNITIHPVFELVPSQDQLALKPSGERGN